MANSRRRQPKDPARDYERQMRAQGYTKEHAAMASKRMAHQDQSEALPKGHSEFLDEQMGEIQPTYSPTPSSNPSDPRTAKAGYDQLTQRMRVWWGDGGAPYDYYEITPQEWDSFQDADSPGKWINAIGNAHRYGQAGE